MLSRIDSLPIRDDQRQELIAEFWRLRKAGKLEKVQEILDLPWGIKIESDAPKRDGWSYLKLFKSWRKSLFKEEKLRRRTPSLRPRSLYLHGQRGSGQEYLAMAIADLLGRPFQSIRLLFNVKIGDLVGSSTSMGFVMEAIKKAECCNPVIFIDHIQYIKDRKFVNIVSELGDPKKNHSFIDRYIGVPFDLSNVLFIISDNLIHKKNSPRASKFPYFSPRRIEGLTTRQRITVAKELILPKLLEWHGLESSPFSDADLQTIIEDFTSENAVRQLADVLSYLLARRERWTYLDAELGRHTDLRRYFEELRVKPFIWSRVSKSRYMTKMKYDHSPILRIKRDAEDRCSTAEPSQSTAVELDSGDSEGEDTDDEDFQESTLGNEFMAYMKMKEWCKMRNDYEHTARNFAKDCPRILEDDDRLVVGGCREVCVVTYLPCYHVYIEDKLFQRLFYDGVGLKGAVDTVLSKPSHRGVIVNPAREHAIAVHICYNYLRNNAERYGVELGEKKEVEVIFSDGGDGLSSGCATFLSMFSAFSGRRVRNDSVTSGVVTLSGRIAPVGGIYYKAKAAFKGGSRRCVLPKGNEKDKIEKVFEDEMQFIYVETIDQLIEEMMEK
ncbi:hypothetical protein QR680_008540 [Steinernema hermaphroditum]|uniref:Lon proteolytic domain-containing protein n=1 Tax=Steinernema hermaphroditum TaxID=289476 RepID=A0AA39IH05_9BILA|nr:hypothetical protein QR680_008540 [Steinernema hermaphroditum]